MRLNIYFDERRYPYLISNVCYDSYTASAHAITVETFQKASMFNKLTKDGLRKLAPGIKVLSKAEKTRGHYDTIKCRLNAERRKK